MNTEIFKNFINELGDISQEYIAKEFLKEQKWDAKADNSPVTLCDKNTELMLRERIKAKFPSHGIIGEEYGNENPDAEFVWVIDPIDGTKSFITKVPLFGTLIGLLHKGDPILGLINQPILKERIVGDNETCLFNGKPVEISTETSLKNATVLSSDTRYFNLCHKNKEKAWREFEDGCNIMRSWGDCYGYMLVCRGLAHIMLDATLEPWDVLPLLPALRGAKLKVGDLRGGNDYKNFGCLATCTQELYDTCLKTFDL
ncbi:MAG: inositol monophosphatase family protein [Opitutales bacterium]